jgi:hypothetical protein
MVDSGQQPPPAFSEHCIVPVRHFGRVFWEMIQSSNADVELQQKILEGVTSTLVG